MSEKSRTISMILSFLFTGIGIVYLGNIKKGVGLFAIGVLCNLLGMFVLGFFHYLSILTWIASLYLTYKEPIISADALSSNHSMAKRHINKGYDGVRHPNENPMSGRHVKRGYDDGYPNENSMSGRHIKRGYDNDMYHNHNRSFDDGYPNDRHMNRDFDDELFEDYRTSDRFDDGVNQDNRQYGQNRLHDARVSHDKSGRNHVNRKPAHIDYEGMSYEDGLYSDRQVNRKNPENNFHEKNDDILSRRRINKR